MVTGILALSAFSGCKEKANSNSSLQSDSISSIESQQARDFRFADISGKLKLTSFYENGEAAGEYAILETIGGGVAALDFDRDGYDDLYFALGGKLNDKQVTGLGGELWRNKQGREFLKVGNAAKAICPSIYTHGAVSGDLNNDGFADLLVTGYHQLALFINQGDGTFLESHIQAGMNKPSWGTSAAFADINNDGCLDIYVAHYVNWSFDNHPACKSGGVADVCAPGIFEALSDVLFVSNGDGTYNGLSEQSGLVAGGKGLGVIATDFTNDGRPDIYVANDTTNNFFYLNTGGQFDEIGLANGTAVDDMGTPQGSMGLCTLDYDLDLLPDIVVCNYENQAIALYKNDGAANFRYVTSSTGLLALGMSSVAWGTSATDFDLDGDEDIVITNGHVMRANEPSQLPFFLQNLGNNKFESLKFPRGNYFAEKWRGRGLIAFDMERDGDMDLVITHINQNAAVLENQTATSGNWWFVDLVGTSSSRNPVGARVEIRTSKRTILRTVSGGGSYLSQQPYHIQWGLPQGEIVKQLDIYWPSGTKQVVADLVPKSRITVIENSP